MHEGTAACSSQIEHRESINDETQLLVRQQRVDEDEANCGEQQQPNPPVQEAERHEEQRAAQGSRHGGVKIPQKGRGLMERGVKANLGVDRKEIFGEIIRISILKQQQKKTEDSCTFSPYTNYVHCSCCTKSFFDNELFFEVSATLNPSKLLLATPPQLNVSACT